MQVDEREVAALRREGEAYAAAGMLYRARLVNEQLALRGADPVALPDEPVKQVRTSTQAATRKKRAAD
jgi:hypothetical protein